MLVRKRRPRRGVDCDYVDEGDMVGRTKVVPFVREWIETTCKEAISNRNRLVSHRQGIQASASADTFL